MRRISLAVEDCERITEWMMWIDAATPEDRGFNAELATRIEAARYKPKPTALPPELKDLVKSPLSRLELPRQLVTKLKTLNVATVADLLQRTRHELMSAPTVTKAMVDVLEQLLAKNGLRLGMMNDWVRVELTTDEATRGLAWYSGLSPTFRDVPDRRIAMTLSQFLGVALVE